MAEEQKVVTSNEEVKAPEQKERAPRARGDRKPNGKGPRKFNKNGPRREEKIYEENMEENVNAFFCHLGVRNSLLRNQNEETMENSDIFYYAKMKKKTLLLHWGNLSEAK